MIRDFVKNNLNYLMSFSSRFFLNGVDVVMASKLPMYFILRRWEDRSYIFYKFAAPFFEFFRVIKVILKNFTFFSNEISYHPTLLVASTERENYIYSMNRLKDSFDEGIFLNLTPNGLSCNSSKFKLTLPRNYSFFVKVIRLAFIYYFSIRTLPLWLRLSLSFEFFSTCLYITSINNLLKNIKPKAILSLSDTHSFEYIFTILLNIDHVKSYTLQHGVVGELYFPVTSDFIFCWGDNSSQKLRHLGVPSNKIVKSGCVTLQLSSGNPYILFSNKYVVSLFLTNYSFELTCKHIESLCSLDVDIFTLCVKFRPGDSGNFILKIKNYISTTYDNVDVLFLNDFSSYDVLSFSDFVLSSHSSALVESLLFECIPVILDFDDSLDIPSIFADYKLYPVCTSPADLSLLLNSILSRLSVYDSNLALIKSREFHFLDSLYSTSFINKFITSHY